MDLSPSHVYRTLKAGRSQNRYVRSLSRTARSAPTGVTLLSAPSPHGLDQILATMYLPSFGYYFSTKAIQTFFLYRSALGPSLRVCSRSKIASRVGPYRP